MRIRSIKTASGKHAIQVVSKRLGTVTVHKHIGTYATDFERLKLIAKAKDFIKEFSRQVSFDDYLSATPLSDIAVSENKPLFTYQVLSRCYDKIGLGTFPDQVVKDLIIARIAHPSSKLELGEYLHESFDRSYSLKTIYRHIKESLNRDIKNVFCQALITHARGEAGEVLELVFYDVTTLYFESQARGALRDFGFSKDHRAQEVQIVIGLVVNKQGFPLYFDIFSGKTFEGHTFIDIVRKVQVLLNNPKLVVVADAAMISRVNIEALDQNKIGFIVGARLGNLPDSLVETIVAKIRNRDAKSIVAPYLGHRLICQYSHKRAFKDRSDRLKQIEKAQKALTKPAELTRRYRFIKAAGKRYSLNTGLIEKAEKLEGIKGYLTNTKLDSTTVIDRYHDLWNVEHSFRITKSDLEARPVFHFLDETIKAHMVIVFAGLAITKYIEIATGMTIKRVLKLCNKVLTHKLTNIKTGETLYTQTTIDNPLTKEQIERLQTLGH